MTRFLLVACETVKWSPRPTCFGRWENTSAGTVCLADRQAEGASWWGNRVEKTLAGDCTIQANLNFQANIQASLQCSISVGLREGCLFLFNLASPINTNRKGCFHLVWKIHRSQGVWLRQLGSNQEHRKCWYTRSCEFAGPVKLCTGFLCGVQPTRCDSVWTVLWPAHRSTCVFSKPVFSRLRGATLCQAPAKRRSEKFPADSTDKILLLQTGSTREEHAGGLKPHFCSISFSNPISQLTNRLCSLLVPGMCHYPYTGTSDTPASSVLPPHSAPPSWRRIHSHF